MRTYLRPLSFLYDTVVGIKNAFYDRRIFSLYRPKALVVSIGNLTVGGTGKTPITDYCLKYLVSQGKRVAVISRSYKALAIEPCRVDVQRREAAREYGDEPVLLAKSNPRVSVFVGPSKWQTARFAETQGEFDLLIVDDGFQHRKLARDLNVVILDATEEIENYSVVPEGRGRESWSSLKRADVVILSKVNQAPRAMIDQIVEHIPPSIEKLSFAYAIKECQNSETGARLTEVDLQEKTVFLVSAIARPDVFEKMMGEKATVSKKSLHFRDHHQYNQGDVSKILDQFQKSQADYLITTEKDAVKLLPMLQDKSIIWVASLDVEEVGQKGRMHEILNNLLR